MIQGSNGPVPVIIVAGMARKSRVMGNNNELLWHVPADLQRFKRLTLGHPIIMGRKTFESILHILGKPLPGRTNIVITSNADYHQAGALTATSLESAFSLALKENPTEIHIGGGPTLYQQTLPYADRLHLTFFDDDKAGDAYFPTFADEFVVTNEHPKESHKGLEFQWVDYERKRS